MIFYGWFIVAAGFLILMVSWGSSISFSVFLLPLSEEFGWSRASTAGIFSLNVLMFGIASIFAGRLDERWSPRRISMIGAALVGGGLVLSAAIQEIWQLYVFFGFIIGTGVAAGWVPLVATISRWFVARRGLAMGIMSLGISFGIIVLPPLSRHFITLFGWRMSFLILGLLSGAVIFGAAFVLRKDPGEKGLFPYGGNSPPAKTVPAPAVERLSEDWDFSGAVSTKAFWVIFSVYLLWCAGYYVVSVHLAAYGTGRGLSPMAAAVAVSQIGIGSIFGKVAMGLLSDRIGPQRVLITSLLLEGISIFGVIASESILSIYLCAGAFGFAYGGIGPQFPVLTAKFFGLPAMASIFGILVFSGQFGGAIGPYIGGKLFDLTQSYFPGFLLGGIVVMMAMFLICLVKPPLKNSNQ
jgi:MFS transporter, OFA family, oxalate/formate antiporter